MPTTPTKSPVKFDRMSSGGTRLLLNGQHRGQEMLSFRDLVAPPSENITLTGRETPSYEVSNNSNQENLHPENATETKSVKSLLVQELEKTQIHTIPNLATFNRTPAQSPLKTLLSPSRFLNGPPLSSSTPRHLRSPRKRLEELEKENIAGDGSSTPRVNPSERPMSKRDLLNLTPKRNVPFVPRTPTPFKRAMLAQEQRHGKLNRTGDVSVEDLSEVLSFIDSPKRSIAGSSRNYIELMPNPRKRVRKALQLDDDGYSSFSGTASERFRSASINSSTAPLWKNAQSSLNSCVAKDFEREQHDSKSKEHVKNEPATTETASSDDFFIKNEPSPESWNAIATGSSHTQQSLTADAEAYLKMFN
ncbi:unnamed protein product [Oikopleura dioica]|uniref:C-myb C-terminal domain-containing protein n=2 Tax=Oikopleura dioica TaxID=34765 RepID=E4YY41_OIKDI|nr:unnamed protein product [Oikopleura dioica]